MTLVGRTLHGDSRFGKILLVVQSQDTGVGVGHLRPDPGRIAADCSTGKGDDAVGDQAEKQVGKLRIFLEITEKEFGTPEITSHGKGGRGGQRHRYLVVNLREDNGGRIHKERQPAIPVRVRDAQSVQIRRI
jgi:hypothetical protein